MIRTWLVPLLLAGALAACDSGAVNPGIVNTSTGGPVSQAPPNSPAIGATGRVVSINEVALRGAGGRGRPGLHGGGVGGQEAGQRHARGDGACDGHDRRAARQQ